MDTSHDNVILTAEERRILAVLEEAAGHDHLPHWLSLRVVVCAARLRSSQRRPAGAVLLLLTGLALMVATFTRWPAVAVIGVALQVCALWSGLTLLAPHIVAWASIRTGKSVSDQRTTSPR